MSDQLLKAIKLLGGGDIYREEFGRYCFCGGCGFGKHSTWNKEHSTSCDDVNAAINQAMLLRDIPKPLGRRT